MYWMALSNDNPKLMRPVDFKPAHSLDFPPRSFLRSHPDGSRTIKTLHPFSVLLFVLGFLNGYIRQCRYSYHPPRQGFEES